MPKLCWILAAAWLLLGGVLCGSAAISPARFNIRTWSPVTENGSFLPQNSVNAMIQSKTGYLWLGTEDGLARFDGLHASTFDDNNTPGLKSSEIGCLFEDSHGNLWIGTKTAGIVLVKDGRVESVPADKNFHAGPLKSACEDSSGSVWLYTEDGQLLHYHQGSVDVGDGGTNYLSNCRSIIAEKSGPIWMGTGRGLFTTGSMKDYAAAGPPRLKVRSINRVDFLVASREGGFWCLADGRVQKWRNFQVERDYGPYPSSAPITSACEDLDGNLVVGTYGDATYWLNSRGRFDRVSREDGSLDYVLSLLIDQDDNLWVGTDGLGVSRVKKSPFDVLDQSEGRSVQSVCEDNDGGLWVGFFGAGAPAVLCADLATGSPRRQYGTNVLVKSVFVDRDREVWAGTWGPWEPWRLPEGGLFKIETNSVQPQYIQTTLPQNITKVSLIEAVSAVFQDRKGTLWVGTKKGLWRKDGTDWKMLTTADGLTSDDVRALTDDAEGNLWIGTANAGLDRLGGGSNIVSFHKSDGLPSEHISALLVDDHGILWVGTSGGLARSQSGKWTAYTTANGLATDRVLYLLDDGQGNLWIGTENAGLMRLPKKSLNDFAQDPTNLFSCRTFGKSDGLPASECTSGSQPAACRTHDGRLWFPTLNGLVSVDPAAIKPNTNPPPVTIESVLIDDVPQNADTLGAAPLTNLVIPAGREQLDIQYTSLNLGAADKARFRYWMEPYQSHPVEVADRRVASYPNLPPGSYVFHVTACNEDGVWNDSPASLAITVLPPFWRTGWFMGATSFCLLALIVGVVYYVSTQKLQRQLAGLRQQQALERERARIARDIHDQLGASLTQVSLLGEMVESDKESPGEVEAHARQISQTARDTARALDEIVWTVNPSNDTLEGLVNYICKCAQEYLAVAGLRYRLDVPAQLPPAVITPEVRHNVFLAAKEAVTNVVRHARAKSAFIRLRLEPGSFTLEIQDDGRGIPNLEEKLAGSRNGLRNMVKRMEDIGGSFAVRPAPEGGAIICLTVPIKNH